MQFLLIPDEWHNHNVSFCKGLYCLHFSGTENILLCGNSDWLPLKSQNWQVNTYCINIYWIFHKNEKNYKKLTFVIIVKFCHISNLSWCKLALREYSYFLKYSQSNQLIRTMIDVPRNNGENIPIFRSMSRLISEYSVLSAQVKCYQLPPYDNSSTWEIQFSVFAINKGADQPLRPLSLINAFVICLLESIIFILATSEIPNL